MRYILMLTSFLALSSYADSTVVVCKDVRSKSSYETLIKIEQSRVSKRWMLTLINKLDGEAYYNKHIEVKKAERFSKKLGHYTKWTGEKFDLTITSEKRDGGNLSQLKFDDISHYFYMSCQQH